MLQRRTDLALEAHELWQNDAPERSGVTKTEHDAYGYGVSSIPTTVFMYAGGEGYGIWVGAMQEEDLLFYTEYLIEDVEKQSTGEQ